MGYPGSGGHLARTYASMQAGRPRSQGAKKTRLAVTMIKTAGSTQGVCKAHHGLTVVPMTKRQPGAPTTSSTISGAKYL